MTDLKQLYLELCMTSVFRRVTEKPLFKAFSEYSKEGIGQDGKIKAYAAFAEEIYYSGASLTDLVLQLVFEDENVYIKSRAHNLPVSAEVRSAVKRELLVFEKFAALSTEDFKADLGLDYVTPFSSKRVDFSRRYEKRIKGIDRYGYGIFSSYPMFRLSDDREIEPIKSADKTSMEKFVGYEKERALVVSNTEAFIEGRPALNTLLCGDAGTGKSSTVKAVANSFFDKGIRLIELRKDQLRFLPYVMGKISEIGRAHV